MCILAEFGFCVEKYVSYVTFLKKKGMEKNGIRDKFGGCFLLVRNGGNRKI